MARSAMLVLAALAGEQAGCGDNVHESPRDAVGAETGPDATTPCVDLVVPTCPSGQLAVVFDEFAVAGAHCGNSGVANTSPTFGMSTASVSQSDCALSVSASWDGSYSGSYDASCTWTLPNVGALILHIDPPSVCASGLNAGAVAKLTLGNSVYPGNLLLLSDSSGTTGADPCGTDWAVEGANVPSSSPWVRFSFTASGVDVAGSMDGTQWMTIASPDPNTGAPPGALSVDVSARGGTHGDSAVATTSLHGGIFVCP